MATLNTAFKQVFGEALEPLGFVKIKSRYPYYVRIINDEILHVITMSTESHCDYNYFSILGGVATVYRKEIDFCINPKHERGYWLGSTAKFYTNNYLPNHDINYENRILKYAILKSACDEKLLNIFENALAEGEKWILPVLNKVVNVDTVLEFYSYYSPSAIYFNEEDYANGYVSKNDESLLYCRIIDINVVVEKYAKKLLRYNEFIVANNYNREQIDIDKAIEELKIKIAILKDNASYLAESEERKKKNIETLNSLF